MHGPNCTSRRVTVQGPTYGSPCSEAVDLSRARKHFELLPRMSRSPCAARSPRQRPTSCSRSISRSLRTITSGPYSKMLSKYWISSLSRPVVPEEVVFHVLGPRPQVARHLHAGALLRWRRLSSSPRLMTPVIDSSSVSSTNQDLAEVTGGHLFCCERCPYLLKLCGHRTESVRDLLC